jgi:hypothetical protein
MMSVSHDVLQARVACPSTHGRQSCVPTESGVFLPDPHRVRQAKPFAPSNGFGAMRRYRYVGPEHLLKDTFVEGKAIRRSEDLIPLLEAGTMTFIVSTDGTLRVADRHTEHVSCAKGQDVLSAGELEAVAEGRAVRILQISNQSTGYCPEPESWSAVAAALDKAGILHPNAFTFAAVFRRCPQCGQRNLVKDNWYECGVCGAELPREWNFDRQS